MFLKSGMKETAIINILSDTLKCSAFLMLKMKVKSIDSNQLRLHHNRDHKN